MQASIAQVKFGVQGLGVVVVGNGNEEMEYGDQHQIISFVPRCPLGSIKPM